MTGHVTNIVHRAMRCGAPHPKNLIVFARTNTRMVVSATFIARQALIIRNISLVLLIASHTRKPQSSRLDTSSRRATSSSCSAHKVGSSVDCRPAIASSNESRSSLSQFTARFILTRSCSVIVSLPELIDTPRRRLILNRRKSKSRQHSAGQFLHPKDKRDDTHIRLLGQPYPVSGRAPSPSPLQERTYDRSICLRRKSAT